MLSGDRQSAHLPVTAQGVLRFKRTVFGGAAMFRVLLIPASVSVTILFMPVTTIWGCNSVACVGGVMIKPPSKIL